MRGHWCCLVAIACMLALGCEQKKKNRSEREPSPEQDSGRGVGDSAGSDEGVELVEGETTQSAADDKSGGAVAKLNADQIKAIEALAQQGYPDVSLALRVSNIARVSAMVEGVGGEILYDPNRGQGSHLPYLFVTLPPEALLDSEFVEGLGAGAFAFDHPSLNSKIRPLGLSSFAANREPVASEEPRFIPTEEIGLEAFRQANAETAYGAEATIAVIDTGVDASHPAFQDRVVFWYDATQEGRVALKKAVIGENGAITSPLGGELTLPDSLAAAPAAGLYIGVIDETAMGVQSNDADRTAGESGIDVNNNGAVDDKILVLVTDLSAAEGESSYRDVVAYIDTDADRRITPEEFSKGIVDFNAWRAAGSPDEVEGMVTFPLRHRLARFPLMFERDSDGELAHLSLGMDLRQHGTHVAGIAAANGAQIVGAAPQAEIMSLKVCSGITCTDGAILRGLIRAFYNEQGLVPDVVNISLGSLQKYEVSILDILIRDLSAKFGAVFVISGSNSGPGYRTINGFGGSSPAILVGAHVSRDTLTEHYNLNPDAFEVAEQNLLYFSSTGPSYTGELRPNIVAPGSALSTVPLIDRENSQMFNGTSMAAPIAAGAIAALIGVLKQDMEFADYYASRDAKIDAVLSEGSGAAYSLTSFPLAMRAAVEESATAEGMAPYTMARVGHGLVDIEAAHARIKEIMGTVRGEGPNGSPFGQQVWSPSFNGDLGATRLYERGLRVATAKRVRIGLRDDGEYSDAEVEQIGINPVDIELVGVEVESPTGEVASLVAGVDELPFAIGDTDPEAFGLVDRVIVNDVPKNYFESQRRLMLMEPGHVYVAQYRISQGGVRIATLLDTVHIPFYMSEEEVSYDQPALEEARRDLRYAHGVTGQDIAANTTHRYPVAVGAFTNKLVAELGIRHDAQGRVLLRVYDPDGDTAATAIVNLSDENTLYIPNSKLVVDTSKKKGIWEVVVAAYSGVFMVDSQYDLLVRAVRFSPSAQELNVAPGGSEFLTVNNDTADGSELSVRLANVRRVKRITDFPIASNALTFQPVVLPTSAKGRKEIVVRMTDADASWEGRVHHEIYALDEDGELVVIASADSASASSTSKTFRLSESEADWYRGGAPVYVALDTYSSIPEDRSIRENRRGLPVEVEFVGESFAGDTGVLHAEVRTVDTASIVVEVRADASDVDGFGRELKADLIVDGGEDTALSIPVYLKH